MKGSATEVLSLLSVKEGQFLTQQFSAEKKNRKKQLVKQEKDEVQLLQTWTMMIILPVPARELPVREPKKHFQH